MQHFLISGVVTVIQCKGLGPIGIRLPSVMGTSFTFVAAALAIGFSEYGIAGILGSSLIGSLVMIIGSFLYAVCTQTFPTCGYRRSRYDDWFKFDSSCGRLVCGWAKR